jgi:hypothetical protein
MHKLFKLIPTIIFLPDLNRLDCDLLVLELLISQFFKSDHGGSIKRDFLNLILIFTLSEVSWICLELRIDDWSILVDQGLELDH